MIYVCVAWLYRPTPLGEGFTLRRSPKEESFDSVYGMLNQLWFIHTISELLRSYDHLVAFPILSQSAACVPGPEAGPTVFLQLLSPARKLFGLRESLSRRGEEVGRGRLKEAASPGEK